MSLQKKVPASEAVTQVEFAVSDREYPFVAAASLDDYEMMLEEFIPRGDGAYAEFFSVTGGQPKPVLELAEDHDDISFTLLDSSDDGGLVEFVVSDNCPAVSLSEAGALPRTVYAENGEGRIEAEIYDSADASSIVDTFLEAHPDAELVAKRDRPYVKQLFSHREFERVIGHHLTDRQKEVLAEAHESGYYQWPREINGEEMAERLQVSAPTMHKHLRAAERKLISAFFDNGPTPESRT